VPVGVVYIYLFFVRNQREINCNEPTVHALLLLLLLLTYFNLLMMKCTVGVGDEWWGGRGGWGGYWRSVCVHTIFIFVR
jgi:hypothetical protein